MYLIRPLSMSKGMSLCKPWVKPKGAMSEMSTLDADVYTVSLQ